jgi:hypothetical protein
MFGETLQRVKPGDQITAEGENNLRSIVERINGGVTFGGQQPGVKTSTFQATGSKTGTKIYCVKFINGPLMYLKQELADAGQDEDEFGPIDPPPNVRRLRFRNDFDGSDPDPVSTRKELALTAQVFVWNHDTQEWEGSGTFVPVSYVHGHHVPLAMDILWYVWYDTSSRLYIPMMHYQLQHAITMSVAAEYPENPADWVPPDPQPDPPETAPPMPHVYGIRFVNYDEYREESGHNQDLGTTNIYEDTYVHAYVYNLNQTYIPIGTAIRVWYLNNQWWTDTKPAGEGCDVDTTQEFVTDVALEEGDPEVCDLGSLKFTKKKIKCDGTMEPGTDQTISLGTMIPSRSVEVVTDVQVTGECVGEDIVLTVTLTTENVQVLDCGTP